jgi:hypothetical protein
MDENPIDYAAVLADLEARRDALDAAIAAIRLFAGQGPVPAAGGAAPSAKFDTHEIPTDAFHGMSIADATRKYLAAVKRKQSTRQIKESLLAGGLHSTSKNFTTTLYSVLERQEDIVRVGKDWGLASWYPGLNRGAKTKRAKPEPPGGTASKMPKPKPAAARGKRRGRPPKVNVGAMLSQVSTGDEAPGASRKTSAA